MAKFVVTQSEFDGLDEVLKKEYKKEGEGYRLNVDGYISEDTTKLKLTLKKVRDELDESDKKLKQFKDIDPEKYKVLLTEKEEKEKNLKDAELELARKQKDTEALEKRLKEDHQKELDAITLKYKTELDASVQKLTEIDTTSKTAINDLTKALETEMIQKRSAAAIVEHGGDPFILNGLVAGNLRIVKDGENYVTRVVDPKGTATDPYRKTDKGEFLTEKELVSEMKQDPRFANNFEGERLPGGSGFFNNQKSGEPEKAPLTGAGLIKRGLEAAKKK